MSENVTSLAAVIRWIDLLAIAVALGAMVVFFGIVVTHLPAWMTPPHYPILSPAHKSAFSSPGLTFVPIEGWAAFAVAAVAWKLRHAIARRWPGLSGRESSTEESQAERTTAERNLP